MQVLFFISYLFILPTYWFNQVGFQRQQPVHISTFLQDSVDISGKELT